MFRCRRSFPLLRRMLYCFSFARVGSCVTCFGAVVASHCYVGCCGKRKAIQRTSLKEICRIINNNGPRITKEANKQIMNFLDVTFNLNRSTYQPFTKPNTSLQYVHRESNHPPITAKNIPAGINERLSSLSSDKTSFDQAAPLY